MAACSLLLAAVSAGSLHAAENKVDAAEAAAAMERAKRQAAGPMRFIMEASKVRRKVGAEPEVATAETADAAARRPAGRTALTGEARAATAPATPPVLPTRDAEPAPAPPTPRQPVLLTLPNALLADGRTVSALPALVNDRGLATADPVRLPTAPSVASAAEKPRLIEMVEPVIPERVLSEIGRQFEVDVDLTIRVDGSVASIDVLPTAPRQITRYVVAAMERWRFNTSAVERRHRVQLIFNDQ